MALAMALTFECKRRAYGTFSKRRTYRSPSSEIMYFLVYPETTADVRVCAVYNFGFRIYQKILKWFSDGVLLNLGACGGV
jgi:hypothetical protein